MGWFGKKNKKDEQEKNAKSEPIQEKKDDKKAEDDAKEQAEEKVEVNIDDETMETLQKISDDKGEKGAKKEKKTGKSIADLLSRPHPCPNCGSNELKQISDNYWECKYCGGKSSAQALAKEVMSIEQALENIIEGALKEQRRADLSAQRQELYAYICPERADVDLKAIIDYCEKITDINPSDEFAKFYRDVARAKLSQNTAPIQRMLSDFDKWKEYRLQLPTLIQFMAKDGIFERDFYSELLNLAKIFQGTDDAVYQKLCNVLQIAVEKLDQHVFDPKHPRDVYVAYAEVDRDAAMELVEYLESDAVGLSCFVACRNISSATLDVNAVKAEAIPHCTVFLMVSTLASCTPLSSVVKCEMDFIEKVDRGFAIKSNAGYDTPTYINWDGYARIPRRYKHLRLEYQPNNDFVPGKTYQDTTIKHFFNGFETVAPWKDPGTDLKQKAEKQIRALIEEQEKSNKFYACKECGEQVNADAKGCPKCGCSEFVVFDSPDELEQYRIELAKRKTAKEEEEKRLKEQARAEAERAREEQKQKQNTINQNFMANQQHQQAQIDDMRRQQAAASATGQAINWEVQCQAKIDQAFRRFMNGEFKAAAADANEVLVHLPQQISMQYIVAFYATFVENAHRRTAVRDFFAANRAECMSKENLKMMKNMILLSGHHIAAYEADALELLIRSAGVQGTVAVATRFCPRVIASRKSSEYLDSRLIELYKALVNAGSVAICDALLASIRTNADSPYPYNSFHLKDQVKEFYQNYVKKIGDIVACVEGDARKAYEDKYIDEDANYRYMARDAFN